MQEMICTCDADGVREMEDRRLRIAERLGITETEELTQAIILSLAFDFRCDASIFADQWFGVQVETPLAPEGLDIECDWPADGLAAIWEELNETFPLLATRGPGTADDLERMQERSMALFVAYEQAATASKAHYATHGNDYKCGCPECPPIMGAEVRAKSALDDVWSIDALDAAIRASFGEEP